ncbi:thioredoxin fold domain-containing protein [uncultured Psychroserpens sp.]|uniref:thioredoxin family protein n=1 Tax=uncultured Psychroserpens sp. TaxID=255436 RepID=UPI002616664A|nr:thioredoxin fold domain-containing protein [uncultured Psychroserpens sp.]
MKKITYILVLALLTSVSSFAQLEGINWVTLDEALELQKKNPKKIMMDVYTNWCGPCKMLDKNTFHNKDVVDYVNENYYAVKFNAEGDSTVNYDGKTFSNPNYKPALANRRNGVHELTRYLKVSAYPTIVFFDENAKVIAPIRGYKQPQGIELYLKLFKEDDYVGMTQEDFSTYSKAFKPEFQQ